MKERFCHSAFLIIVACIVVMSVGMTTKFTVWLYKDLLDSYPSCECSYYEEGADSPYPL